MFFFIVILEAFISFPDPPASLSETHQYASNLINYDREAP